MWSKGQQLLDDIVGVEPVSKSYKGIDFYSIIGMQQNLIKTLQKEIAHLRQYLILATNYEDIKTIDGSFESTISDLKNISTASTERTMSKVYGIKGLVEDIMFFFKIAEPKEILSEIKKLDQKANRKIEPVFIQKILQKEVPVYIQKIKEVEKPVILQKIKYEEKIVFSNEPSTDQQLKETVLQYGNSYQRERQSHLNFENNQAYNPRYYRDKFEQTKTLKKRDQKKPKKKYVEKKQN